jgi:hypothetical protein
LRFKLILLIVVISLVFGFCLHADADAVSRAANAPTTSRANDCYRYIGMSTARLEATCKQAMAERAQHKQVWMARNESSGDR